MNRPAPVEVCYKNMRFLITHNPTNATLSSFIEVRDLSYIYNTHMKDNKIMNTLFWKTDLKHWFSFLLYCVCGTSHSLLDLVFFQDLKKYGATTVVRVCEITYDKTPLEKDGITVMVRFVVCHNVNKCSLIKRLPNQLCLLCNPFNFLFGNTDIYEDWIKSIDCGINVSSVLWPVVNFMDCTCIIHVLRVSTLFQCAICVHLHTGYTRSLCHLYGTILDIFHAVSLQPYCGPTPGRRA